MTVHICPRCNQRIISDPHCEDIEHECFSRNDTIDNEDVLVVGDWEDYTGNGVANNVFTQGTENKLFGNKAGVEGERLQSVTRRGARASTHRQRKHIQHLKINEYGGETW